jgi:Cu+-exporting ATPase
MAMSSLSVVTNSNRLRGFRSRPPSDEISDAVVEPEVEVPVEAPAEEARGEEMAGEKATDPVCGMSVDTATAEYRSFRDGKAYYFCSAGCKESFDKNPARYMTADPKGGHAR